MFRKAALDRLSSPERLDSLMEVLHLKAWILLAGCLAVILAGACWSLLGRVTDEVPGMGILGREGGWYNVDTVGTGPLLELRIRRGDLVARGQVLALIDCPELQGRIREAEGQLAALDRQRTAFLPLLNQETKSQQATLQEQRDFLPDTARAAQERVTYLKQRVVDLGTALQQGLVTPAQVQEARQQLAAAQEQVAGTRSRDHQLSSQDAAEAARVSQKRYDLDQAIAAQRGRLELMRRQLETESRVVSPCPGRIVELLKDPGQFVPAGTPVARLENTTEPYLCHLLVKGEGGRLRPGMWVQLEPAGVPPEQFGRMLGRVQSVSHGPASQEGLESLLQNRLLATKLGGSGDAYLVEVVPEYDAATPSGFRWTSRQGPPWGFGGGTLLAGRIRVQEQAPITLIIPALKRWLQGDRRG
jgi:HlyD family secretion protein